VKRFPIDIIPNIFCRFAIEFWNKRRSASLLGKTVQLGPPEIQDFNANLISMLPRMRRFAFSLNRNHVAAEDLVQSACMRAIAAQASWQSGTNFSAWIFRIVRNLWLDQLRHRKVTGVEEVIDDETALVAPEASAETQLMLVQVHKAVLALPDEMREVVSLVCIEELSYREAAELLNVPIGTVMSRLARARVKLAEVTGYKVGE
jgi:RNA polymerase sigma-70 factor, ECF subfamily